VQRFAKQFPPPQMLPADHPKVESVSWYSKEGSAGLYQLQVRNSIGPFTDAPATFRGLSTRREPSDPRVESMQTGLVQLNLQEPAATPGAVPYPPDASLTDMSGR
jgi:hypothetical protein